MNKEDIIIAQKTLDILKDDKVRQNFTLKNYLFDHFKNSEINPYRDFDDVFSEMERIGLITRQKNTPRSHKLKITSEGLKTQTVSEYIEKVKKIEELNNKKLQYESEDFELNRKNIEGQIWNNKYGIWINAAVSIISAIIGAIGGLILQKYLDIL